MYVTWQTTSHKTRISNIPSEADREKLTMTLALWQFGHTLAGPASSCLTCAPEREVQSRRQTALVSGIEVNEGYLGRTATCCQEEEIRESTVAG